MGEVRTSGKLAAARKAARERAVAQAAEFRQRQEQLEALAAEYFVAVDGVEQISDDAETRIAAIRAEASAAVERAQAAAGEIIQRMLATNVTRDEVAARLGIPVRDVRRRKPTTATPAEAAADAAASDTAESAYTGDVDHAGGNDANVSESHEDKPAYVS